MKTLVVLGVLLIVIAGRMTYVHMNKTVTTETETSAKQAIDVLNKPAVFQAAGSVNVSIQ